MGPQAEQPLLQGQAIDAIGDVEERLGQELAVPVDDPDATGALDDEEAVATVIRRGDVDGIGQPLGDLDELDLRLSRQRPPWGSNRAQRRGLVILGSSPAIGVASWALERPAADGEEGEGNKGDNGRKSTPGALHGYPFLPYRDEIPTSLTCP